ncbi:thiamine phosphate synthase [Pseudalkalibacillus sp. Hm43]|uniref:thiamine phosphate synthase n=1 Tax=Pseudalkalibacillus sp. Hm43 TaxID=3450742 RepID=UPI003F43391F
MNLKEALRLYFVMGSANCNGRDPRNVLKEAIDGGVTFFQFREKGNGCLAGDAKRELALDLKAICHASGVPFIVNDDVELALDVDADGVHIGQEDGSVEEVRRLIGDKLLGVSTHNVEEAEAAVRAGADYIGVGPMFMTKTKDDIEEVRGPVVIQSIREAGHEVPLVGIGGIQASNAHEVMEAGADGVAVISGISGAESPLDAAKQFCVVLNKLVPNIQ